MNIKQFLLSAIICASALCTTGNEQEADPIRFEKGVHGQAAILNGMKTYLTDTSAVFPIEKGMTVSLWVKPTHWSHLAGLLENIGSFNLKKRNKDAGGLYIWNIKGHHTSALTPWNPKAFPLPTGKWSHIAYSYDQKGHGIGYLNGKIVAELIPGKNIQTKDIQIIDTGKHYNRGKFRIGLSYRGSLDDVFIYGRVLSQAEIRELMNGKAPANPLAAYRMDDPSHPGKDSSASKRHLKAVCGPTGKSAPLLGYTVDAPAAAANQTLVAWCRKSVDRVFHYDKLKSIRIQDVPVTEMAGNEWESFQLVLTPNRELKDVSVEFTEFKSGKSSFPVRMVKLVDYVKIFEPSNTKTRVGGENVYGEVVSIYPGPDAAPGWYPDPLRTINGKFDLKANRSTALWISVKTPASIPAGIYKANAKVTSGDGMTLHVPLSIKVRAFSLPEKKSFSHTIHTRSISWTTDLDSYYKVLSDYYLSTSDVKNDVKVSFDKNGKILLDTTDWDKEMDIAVRKYGQEWIFLPTIHMYGIPKAANLSAKWMGITMIQPGGKFTPEFEQKFGQFLVAIHKHIKEKGWLDRTLVRLTDEPHTPEDFKLCHETANLVRKYAPGFKTHNSKWPTKETIGSTDIWCIGYLQPEQIKKAIARGEKVEQYPNWHFLIDRPVMDRRMLGFQMWKYNLSGILHYALDRQWEDPEALISPQLRYPDGRIIFGSGLIMYPDTNGVPTPSIRIDTTRDALEDYEYLCMLEKLIKADPTSPEAKEAAVYMKNAANKLVPQYEAVGNSLKSKWKTFLWELDPYVLLEYRKGLMDRIEKLQK